MIFPPHIQGVYLDAIFVSADSRGDVLPIMSSFAIINMPLFTNYHESRLDL